MLDSTCHDVAFVIHISQRIAFMLFYIILIAFTCAFVTKCLCAFIWPFTAFCALSSVNKCAVCTFVIRPAWDVTALSVPNTRIYLRPCAHKSPYIPGTLSKSHVASTKLLPLLPFLATMSNEISSFRQSRNKFNMFNLFRLGRKDEILRKSRSLLLPKTATMSKQHSTLSKGRNFTMNSLDIVAVWQQSRTLLRNLTNAQLPSRSASTAVWLTSTYFTQWSLKRRESGTRRPLNWSMRSVDRRQTSLATTERLPTCSRRCP